MSLSDLVVEPAKSSRATCKSCMDKIDKGSLRIGELVDQGAYTMERWHHCECYFGNTFDAGKCKNDRRKGDQKVTVENMSAIHGFHGLTSKLQATMKGDIEKKKHKTSAGAKSGTVSRKSKKRKAADIGNVHEKVRSLPSKMTLKSLKKHLIDLGLHSNGTKAQLHTRLSAALKKMRKRQNKKKKISAKKSELTDVQKARELAEELKVKTNKILSQMLRDNCQSVTGSKAELTARVADRMLFGCIPECPQCGNNRGLKVIYKEANHKGQGKWLHRGYFDDEGDFQPCGFRGTHVDRFPWTDMEW